MRGSAQSRTNYSRLVNGRVIGAGYEDADTGQGATRNWAQRRNFRPLCEFARHCRNCTRTPISVKEAVIEDGNVFAELMDTVRVCSLGQITNGLFEVGGQYRRSM